MLFYTMAQMFCVFFSLRYELSIPNSVFRIPHFEKKIVYGNFVFEDATSGSMHGLGQGILYWNNSNNSKV